MITLYYDAAGALLSPAFRDGRSVNGPDTGGLPGAAGSLTFDETTNAALFAALGARWNTFTAPGGVLTHSGQAVTINAPSDTTTQAQQVQTQAQQVVDDITTYLALTSPTNAQTLALVRELARVVRYLLRRFVLS